MATNDKEKNLSLVNSSEVLPVDMFIENAPITDIAQFQNLDDFEDLLIVDQEQSKKFLAGLRQQVEQNVNRKKLKEALKTVAIIEKITDITSQEDFWNSLEIKTGFDAKCLVEAKRIEMQNLENLMRIDSADAVGTAGTTQVALRTIKPDGTEVDAVFKF